MDQLTKLNTYQPYTWAAVVSSTSWGRVSFSGDTEPATELLRGPLIIWATTPSETEEVEASGTAVSALEVQAVRVNMAPHFLAFRRAALGRVRHSIRWKGSRKIWARQITQRFMLNHFQAFRGEHVVPSIEERPDGAKFYLEEALYHGAPDFWSDFSPSLIRQAFNRRTRSRIRNAQRDCKRSLLTLARYENYDEIVGYRKLTWDEIYAIEDRIECMTDTLKKGQLPTAQEMQAVVWDVAYAAGEDKPRTLLAVARLLLPSYAGTPALPYRALWRMLRSLMFRVSLKESQELKTLETARYRAHLTRRVRPPTRRSRIPRPLYARPRPPSAPLAPPVI